MKPFEIFMDGQRLLGFTSATLERQKENMTGSLTAEIFFNYVPSSPVATQAAVARPVEVYIGGHLAFTGALDRRNGRSRKSAGAKGEPVANGSLESSGIGANGYSITLTARGKTKYLIDSSHQHPTTNMKKTNTQAALQKLLEPFDIELDWQATSVDIPIHRFLDGGNVKDEVHRIGNEYCAHIYETREGTLRVIDQPGASMGEALILGDNVLTFNAEQSEDKANSEIMVKGQRQDPAAWGREAVDRVRTVKDNWVTSKIPLIIQANSDATDENLDRRGRFEADKRASQSKHITIEVFNLVQRDGAPYDLGTLHYVEIPPEGVFDVFECIGLKYTVDAENTVTTTLTLAPPASGGIVGGAGLGVGGLLTTALPGLSDAMARGGMRRAQLGISTPAGAFPASWGGADLVSVVQDLSAALVTPNALLQGTPKRKPPLTIEIDE